MPHTTATANIRREFLKQSAIASGMFTLCGGRIHQSKTKIGAIAKLKKNFSRNRVRVMKCFVKGVYDEKLSDALIDVIH
jgi:hypothetical protein